METAHYLTCLWPGLPEIWWRGRMSALPSAVGFALAVNFVLVTRYVFPGWLPSGLTAMAFWIGLIAWGFFIIRSVRELPELVAPRVVSEKPDEFPAAQTAYLRGHFERAERLLGDVLAIEHRDPPALLLLAGVYRQTGRLESARMLMKEIRRLEAADHWYLETEAEQLRLERAIEAEAAAKIQKNADDPGDQGTEPTSAHNSGAVADEVENDEFAAEMTADHDSENDENDQEGRSMAA